MKRIIGFFFCLSFLMSCSLTKPSMMEEDELFITRKYIGDFIEYSYVKPESFGDPDLIWIKTTMESTYGNISAYSKTCKFQSGERLYIRRFYFNRGGVWGDWAYQIESDNNKSYMLSQFQSGDKILDQSWF